MTILFPVWLGLAALLSGCFEDLDSVDRNIEHKVTITSGVYGQLVVGCDTPDCSLEYSAIEVATFPYVPVVGDPPEPLHQTISDSQGFYELALEDGDHIICPIERHDGRIDLSGSCLSLRVANDLSRCDFTAGSGGGNWICTTP